MSQAMDAIADKANSKPFSVPELPTGRYRGVEFYDLEMEHVWLKSWLYAGHSSELKSANAYKLFQWLGRSVIVTRGRDEVVRAFHNTCRHRGSEILQEPQGIAKRFVCPYHAWSYDEQGNLVAVPDIEDFPCLKKEEKGLLPVRCEIWRGFIFINFDADAGPLSDYLAPFDEYYGDVNLEGLEVKSIKNYPIAGNWKAVRDNFIESYHVNVTHRKSIGDILASTGGEQNCLPRGHGQNVAPLRRVNKPLLVGQMDGTRRISQSERFETTVEGMHFFPNGSSSVDTVTIILNMIWPVGPDKSIISSNALGMPGGDPAFWRSLDGFQDIVLEEDRQILPGVQRSIENGTSPTMVLKNEEKLIHWYHEEIDRLIGPEKIDPAIRVQTSA